MKTIFLHVLIFIHRFPLRIFFRKKTLSDTILVIKVDAIGDSVIWLDAAKEYKKHFSQQKLVLLYNKAWQDIALQLPYFDEWIAFDAKRFMHQPLYRFRLLKQLNQYHYQKVLNPTYSRNFFLQDWIVRNVYAEEKWGMVGDYQNTNNTIAKLTRNFQYYQRKLKAIGDKWYTVLKPSEEGIKMELTRNAEFIRAYLDKDFCSRLPMFPFEIRKTDKVKFEKYVVFCLGASTPRKMWSVENFAEVAKNYINEYGIVVCGGVNEQMLCEQFIACGLPQEKVVNLCGKTNLLELISVIKYADFTLSNDTAASHITVAVRTPSVCLLGGGHFGRFQPYQVEEMQAGDSTILPKVVSMPMDCFNCNWICRHPLKDGKWQCICNIDKNKVIAAIDSIIH